MRHGNGSVLGFFVLLLAGANAYCVTPTLDPANPYTAIVQRNVFGLKDPPPPPDPTANVKVEPPKIELQGISTILGRKQVLVKVLAKPPTRPKEESLILNEGDGKDDIEVVSIDEIKEIVSFKIAGAPVSLNMKDNSAKPTGAPPGAVAAVPGIPQPGGIPPPPGANANPIGSGGVATIGGNRGNLPARPLRTVVTQADLNNGGGVAGGVGGYGVPAQNPQVQGQQLSPEAAEVLVGLRKAQYEQQKDERAKLMPKTAFDQPQQPAPAPQ